MRRNTLPKMDKFEELARQQLNKGLMQVDINDSKKVEFQMDEEAQQQFSYLMQEYYLKYIANVSGVIPPNAADKDIIWYLPLDQAYVPPVGMYDNIAQRWELENYWDILTMSATISFLKAALKSTSAATVENLKVRPIMPAELGGAYNGGSAGPNLSALTGTNLRVYGTFPISLNAEANLNVVNMLTNNQALYNVVFVIHKIKDYTVPQNAVGFALLKNSKPWPPTDYTTYQPWLSVLWGRNSYRYQSIGLLTPILLSANQSLQINVYSLATATESLMFDGFVAYLGSS